DPYFVRQPLPKLSGAILTPSTLDVYMNGVLLRQQQIAPGPFEVRNLPVGSGVGQVSYVVRDAFGRTQEFASPYYSAAGVLADGIADYGYSLGFRRLRFGEQSADYGPPEMLARHRVGFGDWLTAGYRFGAALQLSGSIGAPVIPRLNLTLQGQMNAMRDTGLSSALTLRSDLHISNDLSVSVSGTRLRTPGETSQWLAYATLIYSFGGGTTGDVG